MKSQTVKLKAPSGVAVQRLVMALCTEALKAERQYRNINPEAFQIWANSERKGASSLARQIITVMSGKTHELGECEAIGRRTPNDPSSATAATKRPD